MHPEFQIRQLTCCGRLSRTVGFVGLVRRIVSKWVLIVHRSAKNFSIKPKEVESLWTLYLLKLTGSWGGEEGGEEGGGRRGRGGERNRTMGDLDIDKSRFPTVAG